MFIIKPPKGYDLQASKPGESRIPDFNRSQMRAWKAAEIGLIIGPIGASVCALVAVLDLLINFLGYRGFGIITASAGLSIAAAVSIFAMLTYQWIPYRRFDLDRYRDEYTFKPLFSISLRTTSVSIRCPKWMRLTLWSWFGFESAIVVVLSLIRSNGEGNIEGSIYAFIYGAFPPYLLWFATMAAYAAMDVLLREAAERGAGTEAGHVPNAESNPGTKR